MIHNQFDICPHNTTKHTKESVKNFKLYVKSNAMHLTYSYYPTLYDGVVYHIYLSRQILTKKTNIKNIRIHGKNKCLFYYYKLKI